MTKAKEYARRIRPRTYKEGYLDAVKDINQIVKELEIMQSKKLM